MNSQKEKGKKKYCTKNSRIPRNELNQGSKIPMLSNL